MLRTPASPRDCVKFFSTQYELAYRFEHSTYPSCINEPEVDLLLAEPGLLAQNKFALLRRVWVVPMSEKPPLQHSHGLRREGTRTSESPAALREMVRYARSLHV